MEVALEAGHTFSASISYFSFNPCFNGSCFGSLTRISIISHSTGVSILVLMEVALEDRISGSPDFRYFPFQSLF